MQIAIQTKEQENFLLKELILLFLLSFLIAFTAKISLPLSFTPVPLVFQNTLCIFLGVMFGSRRAAVAVFLFLLQGIVGLPVSFYGSIFGVATTGYLIGYMIAAYVVGKLIESAKVKNFATVFSSMAIGSLVVYLCGILWLIAVFKMGLIKAITLGILPFIAGDLLKIWFFLGLLKVTNKLRGF
jgi:biotin transport system substrate-specific component